MKVDLLFPAHNRLAFTTESWNNLLANTDWSLVRKLSAYDINSTDGTREFLKKAVAGFNETQAEFVELPLMQVIEVQMKHVESATSTYVAKIDNDTVVSPGWLRIALGVMERHPELHFLGLEAQGEVKTVPEESYTYASSRSIGGLFVARKEAFLGQHPVAYHRYFGFAKWLLDSVPHLARGWLKPALPFFLLDRLPFEPWAGLSKMYIERGWQRPWELYRADCTLWKWKWSNNSNGNLLMKQLPNPTCPSCSGTGLVRIETVSSSAFMPCKECLSPSPAAPLSALKPALKPSLAPPSSHQKPLYRETVASGGMRVDLGTTDRVPQGFSKYVDIVPNPRIKPEQMVVCDLRNKWPFPDNSVDHFRAHDILEHLPDKIFTMNEIHRCLRPGGTIEIFIPTIDGVGFISDPQHTSYWSRSSFDYFTVGTLEHSRFSAQYGIEAKFSVIDEEKSSYKKVYPSGPETVMHLRIVLRTAKRLWKVVILSKNVSNLRRAVTSVLSTHSGLDPKRIIVVDDGAKEGWRESDPKVLWVEGRKPFVYAANANIGIAAAGKDDVILMGDDCEVRSPNAFDLLGETASRTDTGVVSGGINGIVGNPTQRWRSDGSLVESPKEMAFICVYIPREVLDAVGPFDEQFVGYGCLNAEGRVVLADGSTRKISKIVNNREEVEVLSMNMATGEISPKRVIDWWKGNGPKGQEWIKVVLRGNTGGSKSGKKLARGTVFTPDHKLATTQGWKRADELKRGDKIYIQEKALSPRQKEFVFGSVLGDGSISSRNGKKAGFQVSHAEDQWDYIALKEKMLGSFASPQTWDYMPSGLPETSVIQMSRKLMSVYTAEFADLRRLTHKNGMKVVSEEWLKEVGPFGLAVFYMDDGYIQKGSARLCCHDFGLAGAQMIASRLSDFEVGCTIDLDPRPGKYNCEPAIIRMRKEETSRFMQIVGRYVLPVLRHKLTDNAPPFEPTLWEPTEVNSAYWDEVASVDKYIPPDNQPGLKQTRYCLSVEDNENFFTTSGLAHNCEDVDLGWRIRDKGLKFFINNRAQIAHNPPGMPSEWRSRPDIRQRHLENIERLKAKWKVKYP